MKDSKPAFDDFCEECITAIRCAQKGKCLNPPSAAAGSEREAFEKKVSALTAVLDKLRPGTGPAIAMFLEDAYEQGWQAARAAAPPNDQTLLDVFAEIMEMAPVRHTLGLNHSYESRCTCLRCRADQAIEGAAAPPIRMDYWFHLADRICQRFGIPFLRIEEVRIFIQNESQNLIAAAPATPSRMDFWFHLADKVCQQYGIPFLRIEEVGLFMQNEARHLIGVPAPPSREIAKARQDAFKEVESFIAANGRNADIQSFVEKKICELDEAVADSGTSAGEEK